MQDKVIWYRKQIWLIWEPNQEIVEAIYVDYSPAINSIKGAFSSTKRYKIEIRVKKRKTSFRLL